MPPDLSSGFASLAPRIWLNTAHQGALPLVAAEAAREAIDWKVRPHQLTQARFDETPRLVRESLARLLDASVDDVTLANSASYGLNLIAQCYRWREGDEIVVVDGDFPSDILPWLNAERRHGVRVVKAQPTNHVLNAAELRAVITPKTRVVCCTYVHSFSGVAADIAALGEVCRQHGIRLVVNGSQAVGARPVDVATLPIDALVGVGFKWLCGPYGTGYLWTSPALRDRLHRPKAYWLSMLTAADLAGDLGELAVHDAKAASDFDVFGTANFFNFVAFRAAIEHLAGIGLDAIERHDQALVDRLIEGLTTTDFEVTSPPAATPQRSTLVFVRHREEQKMMAARAALDDAQIHCAVRAGSLRVAPHLYNTADHIDQFVAALRDLA